MSTPDSPTSYPPFTLHFHNPHQNWILRLNSHSQCQAFTHSIRRHSTKSLIDAIWIHHSSFPRTLCTTCHKKTSKRDKDLVFRMSSFTASASETSSRIPSTNSVLPPLITLWHLNTFMKPSFALQFLSHCLIDSQEAISFIADNSLTKSTQCS